MNEPPLKKSALRRWRESKAIRAEEAAKVLGVGRKTYWRYEQGHIPAEKVLRVERLTGVPRQDLRPDLVAIFITAPQRVA